LFFTSEATAEALKQLQQVARLGQITDALFNVGEQYRRKM